MHRYLIFSQKKVLSALEKKGGQRGRLTMWVERETMKTQGNRCSFFLVRSHLGLHQIYHLYHAVYTHMTNAWKSDGSFVNGTHKRQADSAADASQTRRMTRERENVELTGAVCRHEVRGTAPILTSLHACLLIANHRLTHFVIKGLTRWQLLYQIGRPSP